MVGLAQLLILMPEGAPQHAPVHEGIDVPDFQHPGVEFEVYVKPIIQVTSVPPIAYPSPSAAFVAQPPLADKGYH